MFSDSVKAFGFLLKAANVTLVLTLLLVIGTVLVCYPFADYFSLTTQVLSHIAMILTAALLKVAYVARCVAQYNLQMEVR